MSLTKTIQSVPSGGVKWSRSDKRVELSLATQAIEAYIDTLEPGDRVPPHQELMQRFSVSERTVLSVLDDLRRSGRILRRHGVGTFVAERSQDTSVPSSGLAPITDHRTIVSITRPDHSFYDRCIEMLYSYAQAADLELLCRVIGPERDMTQLPTNLGNPYGFVVVGYQFAPLAKRLLDNGHRVVIVGTPPVGVTQEVPCVYHDHEHGGYLVTKHLLELGHRHIAYPHPRYDLQEQFRWRGHQRAIKEWQRKGEHVEFSLLLPHDIDPWTADPTLASAYFRRSGAPTAIAAWNDHEGAKLLSILNRAGISVPGEVSLIGFDALPEGELTHPALTTVDPATGQQIHAAIDLLTRPGVVSPTYTVVLVPNLIQRNSTTAPFSGERKMKS